MQRTTHNTKYTFVENEIHENGEITAIAKTITVPETDPKKAKRMAEKKVGHAFHELKTESVDSLLIIDDELFFKLAVEVIDGDISKANGEAEAIKIKIFELLNLL